MANVIPMGTPCNVYSNTSRATLSLSPFKLGPTVFCTSDDDPLSPPVRRSLPTTSSIASSRPFSAIGFATTALTTVRADSRSIGRFQVGTNYCRLHRKNPYSAILYACNVFTVETKPYNKYRVTGIIFLKIFFSIKQCE